MGRPRIEIDREQFIKLCSIQCTLNEIASFFNCSEDTIERWCKREMKKSFADAYKVHSVGGLISLRRTQFRLAERSYAMAIWLGKQYLGQTDKIITENRADGKLIELIEGLREDDIYTEATPSNESMAER